MQWKTLFAHFWSHIFCCRYIHFFHLNAQLSCRFTISSTIILMFVYALIVKEHTFTIGKTFVCYNNIFIITYLLFVWPKVKYHMTLVWPELGFLNWSPVGEFQGIESKPSFLYNGYSPCPSKSGISWLFRMCFENISSASIVGPSKFWTPSIMTFLSFCQSKDWPSLNPSQCHLFV